MGAETCVYKTFVAKTSLKKVDKDYEKAEEECRELRNRIYAMIAAGPQPPYRRWPWSRPVTWPEYVGKELRKLFNEYETKLERAIDLVSSADILLIVGTSLQVYPAAGLYRYAPSAAPIYIIDPADVSVYDRRITHIQAVATVGMKKFMELL